MLEELLPAPVLSVGLTGHRNIAMYGVAAEAVEHGIAAVLGALQRALAPAFAREAAFFSTAAPTMRLVSMGAEGADLLGARAADKLGIEVAYIMPFAWDEYRSDFLPSSAAVAGEKIARAASLLELPGRRDEGPRAYERANEVILSNIDLLLAVWDGARARGRAGTGDVVQAAVVKGVPIIVINPQAPNSAAILAEAASDDFEAPVAGDLARRPLAEDLTDFVHGVLRPPTRLVRRQGLIDLIAETPRTGAWRIEYPLLLKLVAGHPLAGRVSRPAATASVATAGKGMSDPEAQARLDKIERARSAIDGLAVRYGRLFRSSSVSQYLIVILGVWISGVIGLLVSFLSAATIVVQLLANGLVLVDAMVRVRRRWQERWLDYRVVAEQLRWLRFRYSFGLGAARQTPIEPRGTRSWIDWYAQRMAHALGPPQGKIDAASIAAAAHELTESEIPRQIEYHRVTFRQLGQLERRLSFSAQAALVAAAAVAILLMFGPTRAGGLASIGWKQFAIGLLAVLPATTTALNGMRLEADLVRLVERSAQTIALLFRVKRVILASPEDYDHVAANMQRLAAIMGSELAEWRSVIESRRARDMRRRIGRKRDVFRAWRRVRPGV